MYRTLAFVASLTLALMCSAAAKPAISANVPLPPSNPLKTTEEKKLQNSNASALFSERKLPTLGKAMAIGYYPSGCLQGGVELPATGPNWQVMRVSRNRNWGHPELVNFLERFAPVAAKVTGWHGILIGDMAQPRGGPLPFGHKSHQIGLDVDIWFMPMPDRVLSKDERDNISASNLVAADGKQINRENWSPADIAFIRTAAEQPDVERVLVNAAIKKGALPGRKEQRQIMDVEGASLVWPRRPYPCASKVPGRLAELSRSAGGAVGRRLRQITYVLVCRLDPPLEDPRKFRIGERFEA